MTSTSDHHSGNWLNVDGLIFLIEAGLLFVMSRSLSAHRWQQFYGTFIVLLLLDIAWVLAADGHGANVPVVWVWFDLIAVAICSAFIIVDWYFVRYDRGKEVNLWCFTLISLVAIAGQIVGFFFQANYLVGK